MRKQIILKAIKENEIQKAKIKEKEKIQVPVIVDRDRTLNYETHNWIMKILRVPIMLFLNILPKKVRYFLQMVT